MPSCVIVERDDQHIDQIRDALTTEGWQVRIVGDAQEVGDSTPPLPDLVFADVELPGALELLRRFSSAQGGSSSVALLEPASSLAATEIEGAADLVLTKPFDDAQLWAAVRTLLSARIDPVEDTVQEVSRSKLTSVDIFGDMLAEIDDDPAPPAAGKPGPDAPAPSPATPPPAARIPSPAPEEVPEEVAPPARPAAKKARGGKKAWAEDEDDIQRKLDATLSGVLPTPSRRRKAAEPRLPLSRDLSDVDKLLSDTLSGFKVPAAKPAKPRPAADPDTASFKDAVDGEVEAILEGLELGKKRAAPAKDVAPKSGSPEEDSLDDGPPPEPKLEISFPETTPSETAVPDTALPDTALPDTALPDTALPDTTLPEPTFEAPEPAAPSELDLSFLEDILPTEPGDEAEVTPPELEIEETDFVDVEAPPAEAPAEEEAPPVVATAAPDPAPAEKLPRYPAPGQQFGHYTLLEKIATGGMAEVWKARMEGVAGFQKTVAIKKILPELTENREFERMFVDEAKLAAELNHPNITHIYDLGSIHDDYYIAMEYVEGKNLRSILTMASRKGMPIPQELALLIASRLASALDYAHRKQDGNGQSLGLVHRDVSPQNVLISYEGDIKLCDFGIAKAVTKLSKTETGALKGKLQYMSPEQAWGEPVDARSDIFSLGSLLFEMLTGLRLFGGETEISVLEAVRDCRVRRPGEFDPAIPPSVDALVAKALAKEPADRFPSADRMRDEIEASLESLTLRPSNAELASYLRQLIGAADAADSPDAGPTRLKERVARFPLPGHSKGDSAEFLDPLSASAASDTEAQTGAQTGAQTEPQTGSGPLVEAVAPLEDVPQEPKRKGRLLFGLLLLAALAAALAFYFLSRRDAGEDPVPAVAPSTAPAVAAPAAATLVDPPQDADPSQDADPPQDTQELLERERQRIQEDLEAQLAQQESEIRQAYESQARTLETRLQQIATEPEPVAQPGPGVVAPVLVSIEKPKYPAGALLGQEANDILLSVLVNEAGRVEEVRPGRGTQVEGELSKAAVEAAKTAVFRPATREGKRAKMWTTLKISFPQ